MGGPTSRGTTSGHVSFYASCLRAERYCGTPLGGTAPINTNSGPVYFYVASEAHCHRRLHRLENKIEGSKSQSRHPFNSLYQKALLYSIKEKGEAMVLWSLHLFFVRYYFTSTSLIT